MIEISMVFGLKCIGHKIMIQICQSSPGNQQADYKELAKGNLSVWNILVSKSLVWGWVSFLY